MSDATEYSKALVFDISLKHSFVAVAKDEETLQWLVTKLGNPKAKLAKKEVQEVVISLKPRRKN
jgi:tRNA A37 threonylcarbamoyladenosine modification protein TsaB